MDLTPLFKDLHKRCSLMKIFLKVIAKMLFGLMAFVLLAAVVLVVFLYIFLSPSRDEVARVPSPSGSLVATLIEVNGGATTSFGYEVRIARDGLNLGGTEVALLYAAVRSEDAYGVNLHWVSDKELRIDYLSAKSAEVLPHRMLAPLVRVVLHAGVADPLAPRGGMLYNLQGRPAPSG